MHVYIYIYIYTHMYVCMCIYIYIYIYKHIFISGRAAAGRLSGPSIRADLLETLRFPNMCLRHVGSILR